MPGQETESIHRGWRGDGTRLTEIVVSVVLGLWTLSAQAMTLASDEDVCLRWAEIVAADSGVPAEVMKAIATLESGRKINGSVRPWPWTVQSRGKGHWLDTSQSAVDLVDSLLRSGTDNVDVGCFQLNVRWHGKNFPSLNAMFRPEDNARYAASFLRDLYREFGSWETAASAYHSRTPELAAKYRSKLKPILARYGGRGNEAVSPQSNPVPAAAAAHVVPLFPATGRRATASLVPLGTAPAATPLFGFLQ
ncbi:transglycosylase SLT domain-containing protein [Tropicimonas isoalkanivorans]|uniref:Transglycosylase SLT domain-containing protein n=1 Tax=Tropicimonas isoalkanivorans TaxID=441112 RepID=A0A1I1KZE8_9RHOB|nr:transglycosylase SLT domain-containing protein [Tropicimonas isoalkanivorans]SFC66169.1 Transglycosylase SLT domain-containing protein [Tropicimonas isoalkanivorans]